MEHDRRRRTWEAGSRRDHISGLPDELLHGILLRLRSAAAAARTSVLSRRWRRVWASLPELVLGDDLIHRGASFPDAVDDALAAYSAPHVHGLMITVPQDAPAHRVASWLGFASRRLAGALDLRVRFPNRQQRESCDDRGEVEELELPLCERATRIELWLVRHGAQFLLRLPPPAGTFAALADLVITQATVEGRALEALVSTQCPRLRKLSTCALTLVAASDVSLRSGTLQHLKFDVNDTLRLHVAAPALQVLDLESNADDVYVAAPRLAEVAWGAKCARFVFADAGSHLRRLKVNRRDAMAPLMRRFSSVDELQLTLLLCGLIAGAGAGDGFRRFLDDSNILPKCQTLRVTSVDNGHAFALTVLHLLSRGNGIRKLHLSYIATQSEMYSPASLFRLPKSSAAGIIFDSLEAINIELIGVSANAHVEFLKQLIFSIWSNTKLKNVETNMSSDPPPLISEVCKKIHAMCPSNIIIKSNVFPGEGRAKFETSSTI